MLRVENISLQIILLLALHADLDHSRTRASSDDGGSRANVEGVVPISSSPDNIHHEISITKINGCRDRPGSQQARGNCQRLWSPLETRDVKGGEECTDLGRIDRPWSENVLESELEVMGIEVLWSLDKLVQQRVKRRLGVSFRVLVSQWYRH